MIPCPKCNSKNQDGSNFCKKCGSKLVQVSLREKRQKVLGEKRRIPFLVPGIIAVIAIAVAGFGYWSTREKAIAEPKISSQPVVSAKLDYAGQTVSMTDAQAKVENGKISIPLTTVLEKRIVRFEYDNKGAKIPLLSYVTQSGRVVTAVSMCEPCRSTRFHIEGKTLVCNACATEWELESLKGISGGCLKYPPDLVPSAIEKGLILIDEKTVSQWKPRV
jgi:uncharacterized protein